MRKYILPGALTVSMLAACSDQSGESMAKYDTAEESGAMAPDASAQGGEPGGEIPVSIPQIAYSYQYGYRLPSAEIPKAQQAHVALCEQRGPRICRVINMENSGGEGDYATGMLHLEVAAKQARDFGGQLAKAASDFGGDQIAASISGEDLSKQIVDTEARLRSRELLSQRLTELLRTKSGTVKELVEAERAVTQVNEEIDQARSWLNEMRGRVAFSKITVQYQSNAPVSGGFMQPIREALGGISTILGTSIAAVITFLALLLPWLLLIGLVIYLRRRFKSANRTFWGRKTGNLEPAED